MSAIRQGNKKQAAPKHMNAVSEHFMALQKYLLIFKTQYQTPRELYEQESAVYSDINRNIYINKDLSTHKWAQH